MVKAWVISRTRGNQHQPFSYFWDLDFWRDVPADAPFATRFQIMLRYLIKDARGPDGVLVEDNIYRITVRLPLNVDWQPYS
jgi:hypothetical protein